MLVPGSMTFGMAGIGGWMLLKKVQKSATGAEDADPWDVLQAECLDQAHMLLRRKAKPVQVRYVPSPGSSRFPNLKVCLYSASDHICAWPLGSMSLKGAADKGLAYLGPGDVCHLRPGAGGDLFRLRVYQPGAWLDQLLLEKLNVQRGDRFVLLAPASGGLRCCTPQDSDARSPPPDASGGMQDASASAGGRWLLGPTTLFAAAETLPRPVQEAAASSTEAEAPSAGNPVEVEGADAPCDADGGGEQVEATCNELEVASTGHEDEHEAVACSPSASCAGEEAAASRSEPEAAGIGHEGEPAASAASRDASCGGEQAVASCRELEVASTGHEDEPEALAPSLNASCVGEQAASGCSGFSVANTGHEGELEAAAVSRNASGGGERPAAYCRELEVTSTSHQGEAEAVAAPRDASCEEVQAASCSEPEVASAVHQGELKAAADSHNADYGEVQGLTSGEGATEAPQACRVEPTEPQALQQQ